ncbi:hypothetical protein [Streptomyces sp. NPDC006552]|uniref:hypothetical protein n=1 Tax=Streptomyces sp. NPDC006552 TaxID=3157179 RepID=UPI0033A66B11
MAADHDTATAFATAWARHTGTTPRLDVRERLYRLGTLHPPEPFPAGRSRVAGEQGRALLLRWHREFVTAVRGSDSADNGSWVDTRIAQGRLTS